MQERVLKITRRQLRQIISEALGPRDDEALRAAEEEETRFIPPWDYHPMGKYGHIPSEDHLPASADIEIKDITKRGVYGVPGGPPGAQKMQRKFMRDQAKKDPKVFRIALSNPLANLAGAGGFVGRAYFVGDKRVTGRSEAVIEKHAYDDMSDVMDAKQMARFAYGLGTTYILDDNFGEELEDEKHWYPLPLKVWLDTVVPRQEKAKQDFYKTMKDLETSYAELDAEKEREREAIEREEREKSKSPFALLPGGLD